MENKNTGLKQVEIGQYVRAKSKTIELYLRIVSITPFYVVTTDMFSLGLVGISSYERKNKVLRWTKEKPVPNVEGHTEFKFNGVTSNVSNVNETYIIN